MNDARAILQVSGLNVRFRADEGVVHAVRGVTFSMQPGEIVALVGESGSGKSTIGLTLMRLAEHDGPVDVDGDIRFRGKDGTQRELLALSQREVRRLRGDDLAMIFQEPMSSLNPVFSIGKQIAEAIRTHQDRSVAQAMARALEMIRLLGIPNPEKCLVSYPHELSGGMIQRVMIAMAIACDPTLLIADEPTTGLDVTVQAQIIEYLKALQQRTGMSILFITHDLGLVSEIADRVLVLYAGQVVELGAVSTLFAAPRMPYTRALLASLPRLGRSKQPGYRIDAIPGSVPSPMAFPPGCAFHPRCRYAQATMCDTASPPLEATDDDDHLVRCFRWQAVRDGDAV